jgi:uncharacterized protein YegL
VPSALPVYILLDVSGSTVTIIPSLNHALIQLVGRLHREPLVADIVHLGVISFADNASADLRLTRVLDITAPPTLAARGRTNYGPAFSLLKECIEHDIANLKKAGRNVYRPIAFFVTDGQPTDIDWERGLSRLTAGALRPNILAVGFGDIDAANVAKIASDPGWALMIRPGVSPIDAVVALFDTIARLSMSSTSSVVDSSNTGFPALLRFAPPDAFVQVPEWPLPQT